ncbi:hypothetical protein ACRTDR_09485 [Shewanella algae]
MKHLKKVLLFRVGFSEKVSRQDKKFFEAFLAGQSVAKRRISKPKKWQPKGLPYKVVQNKFVQNKVVQRMKTRCASVGLPSKGGDDETLEKGSVIQSRLLRKSFPAG